MKDFASKCVLGPPGFGASEMYTTCCGRWSSDHPGTCRECSERLWERGCHLFWSYFFFVICQGCQSFGGSFDLGLANKANLTQEN